MALSGTVKQRGSLAEQIADLDDPTPKGCPSLRPFPPPINQELTRHWTVSDFDPEDLEYGGQASDDDDDTKVVDATAGREHYETVG